MHELQAARKCDLRSKCIKGRGEVGHGTSAASVVKLLTPSVGDSFRFEQYVNLSRTALLEEIAKVAV